MSTEQYKIIHLPKDQWKNVPIPMRYTTDEYYDVRIQRDEKGFHVEFVKESLDFPV